MKIIQPVGLAIATALGAGYSPVGPGTCGTLVAVPLFYLLSGLAWWAYVLVLVGVTVVGTWAASVTGAYYHEEDCQRIVIDEVAGYLVTMTLVQPTLINMATGFVLFRVFDVLKPFPAGWADRRVKNAFGVMLDDLLAGLYGLGIMTLLHLLIPEWF